MWQRRRREYNDLMILAWQTANLSRAKRMPSLKSQLARDPTPRQTWQEQLAIMKALTKANSERKKHNHG